MKKKLIGLFILVAFSAIAQDYSQGKVNKNFKYTNIHDVPLILSMNKTQDHNCKINFPTYPIPPMGMADIMVSCNFANGYFSKNIIIASNVGDIVLPLSGFSHRDEYLKVRNCLQADAPTSNREGLSDLKDYLKFNKNWDIKSRLNYKAFLNDSLSCLELIEASKKVVWIGDSLSIDFNMSSSITSALNKAWFSHDNEVFYDHYENNILSVFEQLSKNDLVYAVNLSRAGSTVSSRLDWVDRNVAKKLMLKDQVDRILNMNIIPDTIGIWMGHNDLDWATYIDKGESFEKFLEKKSNEVGDELRREISRLSLNLPRTTKIVIFGMGNISQFLFEARPKIEEIHRDFNERFRDSEDVIYERYKALYPENRARFSKTFEIIFKRIKTETLSLAKRSKNIGASVHYSDAIYNLDWGDYKNYHHIDGWHLSALGKDRVAEVVSDFLSSLDEENN